MSEKKTRTNYANLSELCEAANISKDQLTTLFRKEQIDAIETLKRDNAIKKAKAERLDAEVAMLQNLIAHHKADKTWRRIARIRKAKLWLSGIIKKNK